MSIQFIGLTFEMIGTIFVAYAALRVHHRILREHKIDRKVYKTMKGEQFLGIIGVLFVLLGYFIQILQIGIVG